ncbi:hypothetical protein VTK26DRAFT_6035 [Humicola hyalothermophila]
MSQHLQFPQDQYPTFNMAEHPPASPDSLNMHGFERDVSFQSFAPYTSLPPHGASIGEAIGALQTFASGHGNPGLNQHQGPVSLPMIDQFIHDQGEPWSHLNLKANAAPVNGNPQRQYSGPPLAHFPNFATFRNPAPPSEADTIISRSVGGVLSDSGYGSMARQSVGNPSIYGGDLDQNPETQSLILQFQRGLPQGSMSTEDEHRKLDSHDQQPIPAIAGASNLVCPHCNKAVRTKSELKKHEARHIKPYKCDAPGCSKALEGFSTKNDLDRHKRCVHEVRRSDETVYRCDIDRCKHEPKDWPRRDNFKQHLRRKHNLEDVDLGRFMHRSSGIADLDHLGTSEGVAVESGKVESSESASSLLWTGLDHAHAASSTYLNRDAKDSDFGLVGMTQPAEERDLASLTADGGLQCPDQPPLDSTSSQLGMDPVLSGVCIPQPVPEANIRRSESSPPPSQNTCAEPSLYGGTIDISHCLQPGDLHLPSRQLVQPGADGLPRFQQEVIREEAQEVEPDESDGMSVDEEDSIQDSASEDDADDRDADDEDRPDFSDNGTTEFATDEIGVSAASEVYIKSSPPGQQTGIDTQKPLDLEDESEASAFVQTLMAKGMLEKILKKVGYQKADDKTAKDPKTSNSSSASVGHRRLNKCNDCPKTFLRRCELKKHQKRHEKPYACTFAMCDKKFGSKNDWKRHENSQHFQLEIWRCAEKAAGNPEEECGKVCHRRESLRTHLEKEHNIREIAILDKKLADCRMGRNFESRFWCGFCQKTIEPTGTGGPAHSERFDHIDDHFNGRGTPKRSISEWKHMDMDPATASASPPCVPTKSRGKGKHTGNGKGKGKGRRQEDSSAASGRSNRPHRFSPGESSPPKSLKRPHSPGGDAEASGVRVKRLKSRSGSKEIYWTCCTCGNYWSIDITSKCMDNGCEHSYCEHCAWFENKSTEKWVHDGLLMT